MAFEPALRTRLKDDTAVAAIVGTRIDWTVRPQGSALPAVVLQIIADGRPQHMQGFQRFRETRVQIDCFATTRAAASALSAAVIAAITPAAEVSGTAFRRAFIDTVRDLGANTDTGFVHRDSIDALIWHDA